MKSKCQFHKWVTVDRQLTDGVIHIEKQCLNCHKTKRSTGRPKKFRPLKKKKIRGVSVKRRELESQYRKLKADAAPIQACQGCGRLFRKEELDAHHTHGRAGNNILVFKFICKSLHRFIHANGKLARQAGWLQPEYDGSPRRENVFTPWLSSGHLISIRTARDLGFTCNE